jgi:glutamine---fructose-6-phosphate transaminase (isomerizing)
LTIDPFLQDVIDEPRSLRSAISHYPIDLGETLYQKFKNEFFNNIVLTGHGSSFNSLYPAHLILNSHLIASNLWQTAELLYYGIQQINSISLLIVNSQSGQSAEAVRLITAVSGKRPPILLSITNNPQSDISQQSDKVILLNSGEEMGVSTKTYINALAVSTLLALQLGGENISEAIDEMQTASNAMENYLAGWQDKIKEINAKLGKIQNTIIVGRGASMATAMNAALNHKEAAWLFAEGMNAGEFRHGPLELADSELTLIIIEGDKSTSALNSNLAMEVRDYGCQVLWIGNNPPSHITSFDIPSVPEIARPMAEILPLQLIAHLAAQRRNLEPGKFRRIGKIVLKE